MERLTIPDKKIDGGVRRAFIDVKAVKENAMTIYWALKRYEDTGPTPEQIMELKELDTAKAPREICDEYGYFVCPSCGNSIYARDDFESHKFCLNCGQRIRWED